MICSKNIIHIFYFLMYYIFILWLKQVFESYFPEKRSLSVPAVGGLGFCPAFLCIKALSRILF